MAKRSALIESGVVQADGRLRLPMDRVNAFLAEHPCERVVVTFEAIKKGTSVAQKAYYYKYVLPTAVAALREQGTIMSEERADEWFIEQYPGDLKIGVVAATRASELTTDQMSDFLDWLKQYAAENLYVYIEEPMCI